MAAALLWKDCSAIGDIAGARLSSAAAIIAWCVEASNISFIDKSSNCVSGAPNVNIRGSLGPQLASNLVAHSDGMITMMIETDEAAKLDAEGAESEEALTKVYYFISCVNACGMALITSHLRVHLPCKGL